MQFAPPNSAKLAGFTLIELSIVLVIIGLIIGGILVGQDLINAAAIRAQVSQIEKYNTAVHTFQLKYGYLPGDIPDTQANQLGLTLVGGNANGIIEGLDPGDGEEGVFWVHLSQANLIDGSFNTATSWIGNVLYSGSGVDLFFPPAKIGQGNYIYTWNGGPLVYQQIPGPVSDGYNYFGLSQVTQVNGVLDCISGKVGLSVSQALSIDTKIDDGYPQTGRVLAIYIGCKGNSIVIWAQSGPGNPPAGATDTSATAGSTYTCYDNNSVPGATQQYSMSQSHGTGRNCALSFRFQ